MSALVKIIKNPFDINIEQDVIKVKAKTCIKDIKGIDLTNLVAYVNGEHVNNDYVLKNGDCCVIRQYPSSPVIAIAVTAGVIAAYGVSDAITYGVTGKHIHQHLGDAIKEGLQKWLLPASDGATNQQPEQIQNLPSVYGSKNQSAFGKVVPLILGKTYFTPYNECKTAYNTISGADGCDQMYNCLYIIGQKDLQIEDVSMGLEVLATNSGHVENGALTITSDKFPVADYNTQLELQCGEDEVSLFPQKVVQENMQMQIMNVEGLSEPFYAYSSRYAQKVELEFTFGGLVGYNSDGTKKDATAEITIEYSFDGGETWQFGGNPSGNCKFDFSEATITHNYDSSTHKITFTGQKTKTLRYVLTHTPSYEDMEDSLAQTITYRIKRVNAESTDTNVIDKIYLTAVRTWCYDARASEEEDDFVEQAPMIEKVRNKTTRLGFSIKVDENVQRDFDKINVIATSKARTFDGTGWSKELYPTRNPAALALHCMIGDFRESYAYPITEGEDYIECTKIDLDDFGEKYEICETTRNFGTQAEPHVDKLYYCDGAVLNPTKTVDLVNSVLKCCRSYLVIRGKKYGIFMDKAQDYPLLVLNNNNLLSLTYSKSFDEIPDGNRVKHISEINFYQQNTIDVYPIGTTVTGDEKLVNVEYPFIIDPYHAMSMSLYEQACLKLRPETMTAKVTGEGGLAEIGSLVPVQSDIVLVGIGDGAEITELITSGTSITGIKTDGKFNVTDITKEYGVVINIVDSLGNEKILKKKLASFSQTGTYSQFTFDTAAASDSGIEEGCIVSFGLYGQETIDMLCVGKNENDDSTYELTLVPYDENIYLADQGMIPDFDPKTTPPQESGLPISFGDKTVPATKFDVINLIAESKDMSTPPVPSSTNAVAKRDYIEVTWQATDDIVGYTEIQLSKNGGTSWTTVERIKANNYNYYFDRSVDGYPEYTKFGNNGDYKFRLRNVSINGVESAWVNQTIDPQYYGTWIPAVPSFTSKIPSEGGITFNWNGATGQGGRTLYGTQKYTVTVKYEDTDHSVSEITLGTLVTNTLTVNYDFDRASNKDGYPEVTATANYKGLNKYKFTLSVENESGGQPVTSTASGFVSGETDDYGTWIPTAPVLRSAVAEENGIAIEWNAAKGNGNRQLYGGVKYKATVSYITDDTTTPATEETRGTIEVDGLSGFYTFNRASNLDGYPEKPNVTGAVTTLDNYRVKLEATNTVPNDYIRTTVGTESVITYDDYKTWIPHPLTLSGAYAPRYNSTKRCATIFFVPQDDVYGSIKYGILVSRVDTDSNQFYTPDLDTDCYSDIDSYKLQTQTPLETTSSFKQNLPLLGQDMMSVQLDRYDRETKSGTESQEHLAISREYYVCDNDGETEFYAHSDGTNNGTYADHFSHSNNPPNGFEDITETVMSTSWLTVGTQNADHTTRYVDVHQIATPLPVDTGYKYRIYAENRFGNASTKQTATVDILIYATANSAGDLVDKAITSNKLDDQCVTTDKIAAGSITAEQLAVTNLLAKGAYAGTMRAEGIMADGSGFWVGNGSTMKYDYKDPVDSTDKTYNATSGEFFVGNNPNHESDPTTADEFIHFKPASGSTPSQFWIAIKNIIFQTLQTIVTGIFRVKNSKNDTDANAFLTVNPTSSTDAGTPATTIKVNGDVDANNLIGNVSASALGKYVEISTAASTATKTGVLKGFSLFKGARLVIKLNTANTATDATLEINSTGAKAIRINNSATTSSNFTAGYWNAYYDGTYWRLTSYEAYNAYSSSLATQADYSRQGAYCTTAAGTAAKEASMRGYSLVSGATFPITFTTSNSAQSALTLSVNGTTAKTIYINGSASSSSNYTLPAGTYLCRYSGSYYYIDTGYAVYNSRTSNAATSAGKLTTARKVYVKLGTASTSETKDFSGDTAIPVNGTLNVANGGTGQTSLLDVTVGSATNAEKADSCSYHIGWCSTASGTQNKKIILSGAGSAVTDGLMLVYFENDNTNTGNVNIYINDGYVGRAYVELKNGTWQAVGGSSNYRYLKKGLYLLKVNSSSANSAYLYPLAIYSNVDSFEVGKTFIPTLGVQAWNFTTTSGYIVFSNGLKIQWGTGTRSSSQNYGDVTLSIQFTQTNYMVVATTERSSVQNNATVVSKTDNQHFRFYCNDNQPIMYIAIGY